MKVTVGVLNVKTNFYAVNWKALKSLIEPLIHILLWLLFFTAVNVDWTEPWFDSSLRNNSPAPLSAIFFPVYFYAHGFWIMPKFFKKTRWLQYILWSSLLFIIPESIRSLISLVAHPPLSAPQFIQEMTSRESLLFGSPSVAWFGFSLSFLYRLIKDSILNERRINALQMTKTQSELDQLKAQINPHFLFNSLNALDGLISGENKDAKTFLSNLTKIHRFYLKNAQQDLVPLSEEWQALNHYIDLIRVRYGNAYQFEMEINESQLKEYYLPPATLQFIVENVVKHNVGTPIDPLYTEIKVENDQVLIRNPIRPKSGPVEKINIGLENIEKRVELLLGKKISYEINTHFAVSVPLIKIQ